LRSGCMDAVTEGVGDVVGALLGDTVAVALVVGVTLPVGVADAELLGETEPVALMEEDGDDVEDVVGE